MEIVPFHSQLYILLLGLIYGVCNLSFFGFIVIVLANVVNADLVYGDDKMFFFLSPLIPFIPLMI